MADHTGASLKAGICDAFRASTALVDVQIEPGFPGDAVKAESIYAGEATTPITYPTFRGADGRRQIFQQTTLPFEIRVASVRSLDDVNRRLGEIEAGVREVFVSGAIFTDDPDVYDVIVSEIVDFAIGTPDGYLGMGLFTFIIDTGIS